MKKVLAWCCLLLLAFSAQISLAASEQTGWVIDSFKSQIDIQQTGVVEVNETISVDFGELMRHGIYRDLPYRYKDKDDNTDYTELSILSVTRGGVAEPFRVSTDKNTKSIKIGDPDVVVTGKQTYQIIYAVEGVLRAYEGFDELYWNVTGNEWAVPISSAEVAIRAPVQILQSACYQGVALSTEPCEGESRELNRLVTYSAQKLAYGEGMTVAVGYQPGVVPAGPLKDPRAASRWLTFALSSLVSIGIVGVLLARFWRQGRDLYQADYSGGLDGEAQALPWGFKPTIAPEYHSPSGLPPAHLALVLREQVDMKAITATLIDLAARGYLTITEEKKAGWFGKADYLLARTDKSVDDLREFEKLLVDKLFSFALKDELGKFTHSLIQEKLFKRGSSSDELTELSAELKDSTPEVRLSELTNSFYKYLPEIKKVVAKEVTEAGYFTRNPLTTKKNYSVASAVLLLGIMFFGSALVAALKLAPWLVSPFLLLIPVIFALPVVMPQRSVLGSTVRFKGEGFKMWLSAVDKYQAPWQESEGLFFENLPYAILFGVTKKYAEAFAKLGLAPSTAPAWYISNGTFNLNSFASDLQTFSAKAATSMASSPSSSGSGGGGSSGGGFGGGGGGSW